MYEGLETCPSARKRSWVTVPLIQTLHTPAVDDVCQSVPHQFDSLDQRSTETSLPAPSKNLHHAVRQIIRQRRICARIFDICQRVRKLPGGTPWHGEHDMQRHSKSLGAMDMGKTGGVGNDCVCNKRSLGNGVWFEARPPAPMQHIRNHLPLLADLTSSNR
jgi:hypothetical protein